MAPRLWARVQDAECYNIYRLAIDSRILKLVKEVQSDSTQWLGGDLWPLFTVKSGSKSASIYSHAIEQYPTK